MSLYFSRQNCALKKYETLQQAISITFTLWFQIEDMTQKNSLALQEHYQWVNFEFSCAESQMASILRPSWHTTNVEIIFVPCRLLETTEYT